MLKLVVLETIAANLGSMATPIGNPQNLYLYSVSGITWMEFGQAVWPYAAVSLVMLLAVLAFGKDEPLSGEVMEEQKEGGEGKLWISLLPFLALFVLCLLVVFRVLSYVPVLIVVAAAIFFGEPAAFWKSGLLSAADLSLLFCVYRKCETDSGNQRFSCLAGRGKGTAVRNFDQPGDQQCTGSYSFIRIYGQFLRIADRGEFGRSWNPDCVPGKFDLL